MTLARESTDRLALEDAAYRLGMANNEVQALLETSQLVGQYTSDGWSIGYAEVAVYARDLAAEREQWTLEWRARNGIIFWPGDKKAKA